MFKAVIMGNGTAWEVKLERVETEESSSATPPSVP